MLHKCVKKLRFIRQVTGATQVAHRLKVFYVLLLLFLNEAPRDAVIIIHELVLVYKKSEVQNAQSEALQAVKFGQIDSTNLGYIRIRAVVVALKFAKNNDANEKQPKK